jgi:hemolysin activation/secretion protein
MIYKIPLMTKYIYSFLFIFCIVQTPVALAQNVPDLPGAADTGRLLNQLEQPSRSQSATIIEAEQLDVDGQIPDADTGFVLNEIQLQGITIFEADYFDQLITEYIGRTVDLNILNHLSNRMTKIYHKEGYFLSRAVIPQQEVTNGVVIVQVIEGQIGEVTIDDLSNVTKNDQFNIIANTISKIKAMVPLHGPTMERYILLLNDYIGVSVQTILNASQNNAAIGDVDLVLRIVSNDMVSSVGYNNYGSRFVGPHQISLTNVTGNILNSFDGLTTQLSTAIPASEVQFGSLNYTFPLTAEGLKASLSFSYSNSEPGLSLRDLEVEGDSTGYGIGLSYPFLRSRSDNIMIGGSLNFQQSATEFLDVELIDDKTRTLSAFIEYDTQDGLGGATTLKAQINKGLDILNASQTGSENLSRQQGRSDFVTMQVDANRQDRLGNSLQLITTASGQYAPHPLLSSQEFGYGGTAYGRAFDPSEITGDQGVAAAVELRYTQLDTLKDINLQLVPFAFYDVGKVWNEDRGSEPQSGASAGFGTYYDLNNQVSGAMQFAYPLTREAATPIMNGKEGPRILFNLNHSF